MNWNSTIFNQSYRLSHNPEETEGNKMSFSAQDKGNSSVERRKGLIQFIKKSRVFFCTREIYGFWQQKKYINKTRKLRFPQNI